MRKIGVPSQVCFRYHVEEVANTNRVQCCNAASPRSGPERTSATNVCRARICSRQSAAGSACHLRGGVAADSDRPWEEGAMRVAIYARDSADQQREASIADQLRDCRAFDVRQGWTVVHEYHDAAMSGASLHRPDLQSLLRDADQYDVVLTESLDRLSRDQEDTAAVHKRLS